MKKLFSISVLVLVSLNLFIATVFATPENFDGEQEIECNDSGSFIIKSAPETIEFYERTTNFYNEDNSNIIATKDNGNYDPMIVFEDTRGFDPSGNKECGKGYIVSVVASDGITNYADINNKNTSDYYRIYLATGEFGGDGNMLEDVNIGTSIPDELMRDIVEFYDENDVQNKSIKTAINLFETQEAFYGDLGLILNFYDQDQGDDAEWSTLKTLHNDLEKKVSGTVTNNYQGPIAPGTYTGTITFSITQKS